MRLRISASPLLTSSRAQPGDRGGEAPHLSSRRRGSRKLSAATPERRETSCRDTFQSQRAQMGDPMNARTLRQPLPGGVVVQPCEMGSPVAPSRAGTISASCATPTAAFAGRRSDLNGGQDHVGCCVGAPPIPGLIDRARDSAAGPRRQKRHATRRPGRTAGHDCAGAVSSDR